MVLYQLKALQILIRGGSVPLAAIDTFGIDDDEEHEGGGVNLFSRPTKTRVTMSRPSENSWSNAIVDWPPKNAGIGFQGYSRGKGGFNSHNNSYTQEDEVSWDPELDKDDGCLAVPRIEKKRYAREEQRTIVAKNLSDRATHKDVIDFVRGGLVLDIFLRSNERSASISFVEGSAAQGFMNYVKRNDVYVHGKRASLPVGSYPV